MSGVLVVAAHLEDEELGCSRTIARHADCGDQVRLLAVAEGSTSPQQERDPTQVLNELSSLAPWRGAQVRVKALEAFSLLRQLL